MDQNASSSSSSPTRVQLPSIRNLLVETQHPPLPVYRSLQVAPELAPLSQQRRQNEDTGTPANRPLHASPPPVPPPRFSNAVSATLPGSPFGLHGHQQAPQSASANDVMQAPASRAPMSGAPSQASMRSRHENFRGQQYIRIDNPPIAASATSMDSRPRPISPDNNSIHPTIHHGHGYRQSHTQGQGTNNFSSNTRSNRYGDVPTFAYPSTPDRNGVGHATVHDLRSMSTSESQSHRGGHLQRPSPERFRTSRGFEQQSSEEYDARNANASWSSQGRHSRASLDEWDANSGHPTTRNNGITNTLYAQHYESYDSTTTGRERGYPYSPAGSSQRGRESAGYHHRQDDNEYVSRLSPQNLRPMQWDSRYARDSGYASSSSARASFHSTGAVNVPPLAIRHRSHGSSYSPPGGAPSSATAADASQEWQTGTSSDRSYRTGDYSVDEEYSARSAQPYPSPVTGQMSDRVHPHAERYIRGPGPLQALPGRMNDSHPSSRFPRDELPGVLTELTNEARAATQEGKAMRKIRDFSNTLMQFALHARHQGPLTTPEAVQEMSHRAELMYRMARELRKWKKATVARTVEPPPKQPVPRQAPKQQIEKKKPLTKEEKRNLDDLEKIKKKRASAQAGIKSKYMKRNKKTPPPKKCSSCGIRDTPEWRKGPDGPRSLCNACGLHYAKLMRNRAVNEGRWVGNGPPPPIDIITLRQVTGVGIQPQETARGEYEIPGVYENIPASHVMQGASVRRSNPGSAASSVNPSSKPSSSMTVRVDETTAPAAATVEAAAVTVTVAAKSRSASTNDSTTTEKPNDPVPVETSIVESSAGGKGKKRKADDLDEEDETMEDPDHPTKRRRLSPSRMEDVQMHPSTSVESLPASTNSSRAAQTDDSTAEHSF